MRLERIRIRNIGALRDVDLDLAALGDGARVVAVTGPNGAGKTTLLEAGFAAALYRVTPTRGSLTALATTRDAFVEAHVVNGQAFTLRHLVDAVSAKGESIALDADGRPCFESSKVRDFDRWAASKLPPPEVFYSTAFAPQGSAGFLGAKPAERKAVLLRALGIEQLEAIAERMREHKREAKVEAETLERRLADERQRGGDVGALVSQRVVIMGELEAAKKQVAAAERDLAGARKLADEAEQRRRERDDVRAKRVQLQTEIDEARKRLADIEQRAANNRAVLAEADQIRAAVARRDELCADADQADREADRLAGELDRLRAERAALRQQYEATEQSRRAALERAKQAETRLADREAVERAKAELPAAHEALSKCHTELTAAREELERLSAERLAGADERIGDLRCALAQIAGSPPAADYLDTDRLDEIVDELRGTAESALEADDDAEQTASEHPQHLAAAKRRVLDALQCHADAELRARNLEAAVARAQYVDQAQDDLDAAEREAAGHRERADQLATEIEPFAARETDLEESVRAQRKAAGERRFEAAQLDALATKAKPLEAAEARLAELDPQRAELAARIERLDTDLRAAPEPEPSPPAPDVAAFERAHRAAQEAHGKASSALAVASERLEAAEASAERQRALECELRAAHDELSDWTRLADDLGRNGIQAAEIDAAGPELTTLTNDLLHSCHGPRFTVRVDTQRLSADGKKSIEGCEVMVIDTVGGREAPGETFSGGERVIIGEALSLALTMLACRRAGVEGPTLVRDESGAALDPDNGGVYVAMLRRAAEIVGASRVLFVSHDAAVQALADARIEVADGTARIA